VTQHIDLPARAGESRTLLWDLAVGTVENLRRDRVERFKGPREFSPEFQVCLPYRGVLVWHVGADDVVGDANQVLFVTGSEEFRISSPTGAYAELIITPRLCLLSELAEACGFQLRTHPLFERRSWRTTHRLQAFRAQFLHWATRESPVDELEAEELVMALLRSALEVDSSQAVRCGRRTAQLIRRAKEFLASEYAETIRLADVAQAVNVSPTYLTDTFSRVEGTSLHRYLMRLRLARALDELPHAGDLTQLALDLGFSSHSHFTVSFRRAFGYTPSEFRATARRAVRPSVPWVERT
jgi:AraC-like DNA-binding protein